MTFRSIISAFAAALCFSTGAFGADKILLEAEQFSDTGGWSIDQQFMDQMGSPYLLAHGLGDPVKDATTTLHPPKPGKYHVWVRTRDWVAPWKAPGAPGRFQILLNGSALPVTFGTEGAAWHWQEGGITKLSGETKLALHDLTGFEGRCDAILFSSDLSLTPPNESEPLKKLRHDLLGLPNKAEDGGTYDLVVVGGGIAGTSAAIAAARNGLKVALFRTVRCLAATAALRCACGLRARFIRSPIRTSGTLWRNSFPRRQKQTAMRKTPRATLTSAKFLS